MKKSLLTFLSLVLVALPVARGTTVGFSPVGAQRLVVDSSSTLVGTSSLALVGNFTTESFTFNPSLSISANVAAITTTGGWKQFGLDTGTLATDPGVTLPGISINASGKLSGSITDNNGGSTQAVYFNTKNLYVWLFNATTIASATQMGIFRSTDAVTPWLFPTNGGVSDTITFSTTSAGAPTMVSIGGAGSATTTNMQLVAATVPEPSALALVGVAGMGMLAARRRKQRN